MTERRPATRSTVLGYFAAFALTASTCLLLLAVRDAIDPGHAALIFLLAVWASAAVWGVGPGVLAAVLSFSALIHFFVPPYYRFAAGDPADWITLVVFVTVAGIQGWLTGRLREREMRAVEAERDAETFTTLAGQLVSESSATAVGEIVTSAVAKATGAERVAVLAFDDSGKIEVLTASRGVNVAADAGIERYSGWVLEHGIAVGVPTSAKVMGDGASGLAQVESAPHDAVVPGADRSDVFLPVAVPERTEAVLYIGPLPGRRTLSARDLRLVLSLAQLLGAFLERHRLQYLASQADTVRESERLKSTLVSSVSHELKTPLAAMTATVSGLLASDAQQLDAEHLRQDLEAVEENLRRLTVSIGDLLDISRLESDAWKARREPYDVSEIVGSLLGRLDKAGRSRISLEIPEDLPPIEVDFVQWSRALSSIVENALAYSGPEGSVRIGARAVEATVQTWVEDDGPGIPAEERSLVFDKFYRGSAAARVPSGTGLGLTIAQEIVRFNGGTIEAEAAWPHGARIVVSAPVAQTRPSDAEVA